MTIKLEPHMRSVWDIDWVLLETLHLLDNEGLSGVKVARIMEAKTGHRITKGAVLGVRQRVKIATDEHDKTPELNGTMAERWWQRWEQS